MGGLEATKQKPVGDLKEWVKQKNDRHDWCIGHRLLTQQLNSDRLLRDEGKTTNNIPLP
jgi:hypothetical protein